MPDGGSYTGTPAGTITDRTGALVSQIQFHLATFDQGRLEQVLKLLPEAIIYDKLQRGQEHLAQDLLCIEKKKTDLSVSSGAATEPTGFYRMKQLVLPSTQYCQPIEIDVQDHDRLTRNYFTAGQKPQFYFRWNGTITLYPTPSDGTYTMYYYGVPTTQVSQSQNPETPQILDEALLYFGIKECAPVAGRLDLVPAYEQKYVVEKERAERAWGRTKTLDTSIVYHDV